VSVRFSVPLTVTKIDLNHYTAIILTSRNAVDHFRVAENALLKYLKD
jgi:uroporphyrinogen-III synthase